MPTNKRQHYVPKHMLKRFAADAEGKRVNLLHISTQKTVRGASLREQCYKDYFYGTNLEIERNLSLIEGSQSLLVEEIIASATINPFRTADIALLFALQRARTLRSENETSGVMNALMKLAMYGRIDADVLRNVKISLTHGPNLNVTTALRMSPILYDLKQILLVNRSKTPFVISDSPVVTTNWFCRTRYPDKGPTGFSLSGLQMFMPLTPTLALVLLDSGVYSTEAVHCKMVLHKSSDIEHLNTLQWLNALNTVYFPSTTSDVELDRLKAVPREGDLYHIERLEQVEQTKAYRKSGKGEYDPPSDGVTSEIVRFAAPPLPLDVRFSGLRIRKKPSFYDDGTMASPIRDPFWVEIIRDFDRAVEAKAVAFGQLADFIETHPLEPAIGKWRKNAALRARRARPGPLGGT